MRVFDLNPQTTKRSSELAQTASRAKRAVILHFHTYKNAGTTIDQILMRCFSRAWTNFDGPVPEFFIHHSEIAIIAANRPHLKAISSHQIRLPVPEFPRIDFLPIAFIRRPELRIASIWRFERERNDNLPATLLARNNRLRDWVVQLLKPESANRICNSQTFLFAFEYDRRARRADAMALKRAMQNIAALPFMGVVERFEESMRSYERLYSPLLPEFQVGEIRPANVTGGKNLSVEDQLAEVEVELGSSLFRELEAQNSQDIALYEFVLSRFPGLAADKA